MVPESRHLLCRERGVGCPELSGVQDVPKRSDSVRELPQIPALPGFRDPAGCLCRQLVELSADSVETAFTQLKVTAEAT